MCGIRSIQKYYVTHAWKHNANGCFQLALCHLLVFLKDFPLWNLEFSEKFSRIGFGSGKEMPPEGAEKGRLSESHIYARVENFFQSDIAYNAYIISHICADASAPDPAAAGHHLEQKFPFARSVCRKIRKIKSHIAKKNRLPWTKMANGSPYERENNNDNRKKITNYFRCLRAHHTRELPKSARPELQ